MYILGIACHYHDASACLIEDGRLVAAAEEERFTRKKHDHDFPEKAIQFCLDQAGITTKDLDAVGFYEKPMIKFMRLLETFLTTAPVAIRPFLRAVPLWMKQKLWIQSTIQEKLEYEGPIYFVEHHLSHAASAFLPSPFQEAAILTTDGVGEWTTTSYGVGRGSKIELTHEINFPHSLGLLYSTFTAHLGFRVNNGEYKVMGLAPYGKPTYVEDIRKLIDVKPDGSFHLDMSYFKYHRGLVSYTKKFLDLFGPPRKWDAPFTQKTYDLAFSLQQVLEEVLLKIAVHIREATGMEYLCMAGGVALNCVANGRLLREAGFKDIFIQPAAGDDGGSLGAAYYIHHCLMDQPRTGELGPVYLGPSFTDEEIRAFLDGSGLEYRELDREELLATTARLVSEDKVVGWFQGRMELGPRALGNRSILANAMNPDMKDILNAKIKLREGFRPFAPSVQEERVQDYFEIDRPSPYMLLVAQVREDRRVIPSVTHVNGSARLQTVSREQNALYHDLIGEFAKITGVPVIINTSFNIRGEPIVCTPEDAYRCYRRTQIDCLVMGRFLLQKTDGEQPEEMEHLEKAGKKQKANLLIG